MTATQRTARHQRLYPYRASLTKAPKTRRNWHPIDVGAEILSGAIAGLMIAAIYGLCLWLRGLL